MSYLFTREWKGLGATQDVYLESAGASIAAAAPLTGPAAPFVAIGGLIVSFLGQMGIGSGCGQTCVLSTQYANQAEALLRQNINAYFAVPTPRPQSVQTAALQNFSAIWNDLQQQCSNPQLGTAGQNCISDRQSGACKWKQPASSVPPWGSPAAGDCWNWWNGYHDPIANDPNVVPDSALSSTAVNSVTQAAGTPGATTSMLPLLMLAGAAGLLWAVS